MCARVAERSLRLRGEVSQRREQHSEELLGVSERLLEDVKLQAVKKLGSLSGRELVFTAVLFNAGKNLRINIPRSASKFSNLKAGDFVLVYLVKLGGEGEWK